MFDHPQADCGYAETDPTGRYGRFPDVLGKGAMKMVYRAFDELEGMEVAWNQAKICDVFRSPDALERLYSEVHLLSTFHHDSIIHYLTSWVDGRKRTFNFITELFTSGTLREYIQRYRRVDIRAVKNWARQILHGLVYLHSHDPPVIHRDLKCDNIFINGHLGQVKIGDLGLAAILKGSRQAHSVIGTPEFMAPELYEEEYNELVDTYSFGMCLLEMLTGEYPYNECSNPAQIYKKVTSGKLPTAFHRLKDLEAKRLIGRCLEEASRRPSAKELLLDPFLQIESDVLPMSIRSGFYDGSLENPVFLQLPVLKKNNLGNSDMKITGKLNPDDDTIILRVQISEKNGHHRNIYFPFDILHDTAIDVANEMVRELEIVDHDPSQIADMIDREITALVPNWKDEVLHDHSHHVYSYREDSDGGIHNHFYYLSSPTSSQSSCFSPTYSQGCSIREWLPDCSDDDDGTTSQMSTHSGNYSALSYASGSKQECEQSTHMRDVPSSPQIPASSKLRVEDAPTRIELPPIPKFHKQCSIALEPPPPAPNHMENKPSSSRKLTRNRSLVDLRSQLLHRTLVEEVNKRLFKTVGSVENIGFQNLYEASSKGNKSSQQHCAITNSGITWGKR